MNKKQASIMLIPMIILVVLSVFMFLNKIFSGSKDKVYELSGSTSHFFKGRPKLTAPKIEIQRGETQTINRNAFSLEHSSNWKTAVWVCELLTAKQLKGDIEREDRFGPDPKIEKGKRAESKDYTDSGFDRGQLAPAGDYTLDAARKKETFFLSNMVPQRREFKRGIWKSIEDYTRRLVEKYGELWVITGVLFLDESEEAGTGNGRITIQRIGPNRVAVPTHFYKVIIRRTSSGPKALTLVVRNRDYDDPPYRLDKLVESVDWVEERAGVDFMPELTREQEGETETAPAKVWWSYKGGLHWPE